MKQKLNVRFKATGSFSICLLFLIIVSLGCSLTNKLGRSYEQQPFDEQKWRKGDAQERGTMFVDLFKKRKVSGKSKEEVLALFGEPDKKSNGDNIWHYKIELAGENPVQYFPVSFDKNGKATIGMTQP